MQYSNIKNLIRNSIGDVLERRNVSDFDLSVLIRRAVFEIAEMLRKNHNTYYKKSIEISVTTGEVRVNVSDIPISETISQLVYAYAKSATDKKELSIKSVEGVYRDEFSADAAGSIAYSKSNIYIHSPAGFTSYTAYVVYYTNPAEPAGDTDDIDVPASLTGNLVNLVKKYLYESLSWPLPGDIADALYKVECQYPNREGV